MLYQLSYTPAERGSRAYTKAPAGRQAHSRTVDSAPDIRHLARLPVRECAGGVAERSMAADCKSAGFSLRWFKSNPLHHLHRDNRQKFRRGRV